MRWLLDWMLSLVDRFLHPDYDNTDYESVGEDVRPHTINEEWKSACDAILELEDKNYE